MKVFTLHNPRNLSFFYKYNLNIGLGALLTMCTFLIIALTPNIVSAQPSCRLGTFACADGSGCCEDGTFCGTGTNGCDATRCCRQPSTDCPTGFEQQCGSEHCIPLNAVCCDSVGHPETFCQAGQTCETDGTCSNLVASPDPTPTDPANNVVEESLGCNASRANTTLSFILIAGLFSSWFLAIQRKRKKVALRLINTRYK